MKRAALFLAISLPIAAGLFAADKPDRPQITWNKGGLSLSPVSELEQDTTVPKIGNGSPSKPSFWPATFIADAGGETCTATLIGPRALLTAAHCVGEGQSASISRSKKIVSSGACTHAKSSDPSDPSGDWALCYLDPPVVEDDVYYEYIDNPASGAMATSKNARLLGIGFGCQVLGVREDPGILREGFLFVDRPSTVGEYWPNWIFTKKPTDDNGAFICPGDSGGAIYFLSAGGKRYIVAVASGVQADKRSKTYLVSYLASLNRQFQDQLLKAWVESTQALICGYGALPKKCRIQ